MFSLKNPHKVPPTRFMKRKESEYSIYCECFNGPIFGGADFDSDELHIDNTCHEGANNYVYCPQHSVYEFHPEYKSSFFVDTGSRDEHNPYDIMDFEVFGIDYESKYTIDHLCKHPEIMREYIQTNNISERYLNQFDDDIEILNDLDLINCRDSSIRLKISNYYFNNPSSFLVNTHVVNQQYDIFLKNWFKNDTKWMLLYRASEHGYSGESFHEYCDYKGPTLIIIKSTGGWIFGGYTTQSWDSDDGDYNDMEMCI